MPQVLSSEVSGGGLRVEFDIKETDYESSEDDYFDDEACKSFKSEMMKLKLGEEENLLDQLENLSIEELKAQMTPITEDNLVLKLLLHPGTGVEIPPKSIVTMHYEGFVEGESEPFDSTYKRNKPFRFLFNSQKLILGLDLGASTMRCEEVAQYWIHYSYAYGPMGCPPRIPGEANVIYKVEILNCIDSAAAIEFEEMESEDQRNAPFEKVYNACKVEHKAGNDLFNNKKYSAAISRYQRARKLLEVVNVKDEGEDNVRTGFLLKLYLNLAVTYFKLKKSTRVIFHSRRAIEIDEENVKALFYMGRGLMLENEFDRAKNYLERAKNLSPFDPAIIDELKHLEDKRQKCIAIDKQFCQRMFDQGTVFKRNIDSILRLESPEFVEAIRSRIERFKNSAEEEYVFASTYTPTQIEVIAEISKSMECHFVDIIYQGQKVIKIKKMPEKE